MATRMQQRRGTAAQWTAANPILNVGEIGYETDTNKFKIGDGTNHWADLVHFYDAVTVGALIDEVLDFEDAPELLNTVKELANALGNDPDFLANLATYEYVDNAVAGVTIDLSTAAGNGLAYNGNTEQLDADPLVVQFRVANVSDAEIGYLEGVSSNIQTQLDSKQAVVANVSDAEISYLANVTSDIQAQLDAKAATADITELSVDAVANALTSATHTNITVSYDDNAGTISLTAAPGYTDENAQDAIGLNLGTGLSYDDASGAISVNTSVVQARVANVSDTEIGYLDGVTSAIQTQIDSKLNKAGDTMTGALTLSGAPTEALHAATKAYVDAVTEGLHIHPSVKAATTTNVALSTALEEGDTLDGVTLFAGDRILVKNQSTQSENGIYVVQNSGQPTRATDFDTAAEVDSGDFVFVTSGTVNANTGWVQIQQPATIGTDPISFTQFSGAGTYTASGGITLTGNNFAITNAAVGTFAATPSSANLAAAVSDETGSGALVFGTSPTLVTPRVQLSFNAQSGTTYTLVLADASSKWVTVDNASGITVTVPPSVFSTGDQISVQQTGAGQITFAQGSGVTITSAGATTTAPKIRTRYASATVICTGSNTFTIIGDIV